MLCRTTTD